MFGEKLEKKLFRIELAGWERKCWSRGEEAWQC